MTNKLQVLPIKRGFGRLAKSNRAQLIAAFKEPKNILFVDPLDNKCAEWKAVARLTRILPGCPSVQPYGFGKADYVFVVAETEEIAKALLAGERIQSPALRVGARAIQETTYTRQRITSTCPLGGLPVNRAAKILDSLQSAIGNQCLIDANVRRKFGFLLAS